MDMYFPQEFAEGGDEASEAAPPIPRDNDAERQPLPKPVLLKFGESVMSGVARGPDFSDVEWDWSRVVDYTGIKSNKDHYYLKRNWQVFRRSSNKQKFQLMSCSTEA